MTEKILCAAIHYTEFFPSIRICQNVDGLVIFGHRHHHCIRIMFELTGKRTVQFADDGVGVFEQGFLTSLNRFVGRKEAYQIAVQQNQTIHKQVQILYSEDLY